MDRFTVGQLYHPKPSLIPLQHNLEQRNVPKGSFEQLLREKLKLSQHAEARLKQRGIQLNPEQMAKIESAIEKAEAKGAKDSLFVMQDLALIVSVKNRTVVTAVDAASMKDHVFTQIDSAVIIT